MALDTECVLYLAFGLGTKGTWTSHEIMILQFILALTKNLYNTQHLFSLTHPLPKAPNSYLGAFKVELPTP